MTAPIPAVESAVPQILYPRLIPLVTHGAAIEPYIAAPYSDSLAADAGEICLPNHRQTEAAIQHVIPGIQLGEGPGVAAGKKVDNPMGHVNNRFLCTYAIHGRNLVVRQIGGINSHATAAMRIAGDSALFPSPFQNWQIPRRPIFNELRAGIVLIPKAQQNQMAGMTGGESRYLDVVTKGALRILRRCARLQAYVVGRLQLGMLEGGRRTLGVAGKKQLLVIPTWAPGEHIPNG